MIEAIPASNDVNLPGLATTETLTRHVNLNYFSEAVSWEGEERLADADSWRITGNPQVIVLGRISIDKRLPPKWVLARTIDHNTLESPKSGKLNNILIEQRRHSPPRCRSRHTKQEH